MTARQPGSLFYYKFGLNFCCRFLTYFTVYMGAERETRCRRHSIDIVAEQAALVWACAAKR